MHAWQKYTNDSSVGKTILIPKIGFFNKLNMFFYMCSSSSFRKNQSRILFTRYVKGKIKIDDTEICSFLSIRQIVVTHKTLKVIRDSSSSSYIAVLKHQRLYNSWNACQLKTLDSVSLFLVVGFLILVVFGWLRFFFSFFQFQFQFFSLYSNHCVRWTLNPFEKKD